MFKLQLLNKELESADLIVDTIISFMFYVLISGFFSTEIIENNEMLKLSFDAIIFFKLILVSSILAIIGSVLNAVFFVYFAKERGLERAY